MSMNQQFKHYQRGFLFVLSLSSLGVKKPWVRWPPSGRSSPMIRPCGSTRAVYTAKLALKKERLSPGMITHETDKNWLCRAK